jgi:hypothetical protein
MQSSLHGQMGAVDVYDKTTWTVAATFNISSYDAAMPSASYTLVRYQTGENSQLLILCH